MGSPWSTMLLALSFVATAAAASLPGVPLSFDVDASGRWVLPAALPEAFVQAGVAPGWALTGVDGQAFAPDKTSRQVAAGPARMVQLEFATPQGETVLVVPRAALVQVEELGLLAFPAEVSGPVGPLERAADGSLWVRDAAKATFRFDPGTGALSRGAPVGATAPADPPPVFWSLTDAPYVLLPDPAVRPGPVAPAAAAEIAAALPGAARLASFQGKPGEHLLVPNAEGLSVYALSFPRGTPNLPSCTASVPESCFVAGQQVAAELSGRPGGPAEAQRLFDTACEGGVYRACVSAFVLGQPGLSARADACLAQDANACHALARGAMEGLEGPPDTRTTGVLEVACAVDASGSLGERLRRLEDVGEGCMLLSRAFDARAIPDRALLSLDQACLLGRADACTEATRRRADAFALRTVRECEDAALPLASACVQLGRLLQQGPIAATQLDDFGAFQRACVLGDEDGCVLLGDYVDRWGITHPRVVAAETALRSACRAGEQRACVGAGHLLVRHEPRSEAYGEALGLFAGACAAGLPSGCIAGAEQRRIGAARKVEAPEPTALWSSACDQASAPGCAGLGERLARERNTWDGAYTAWTRACDTGEAAACTDLGQFVTRKHEPTWPGEQPFDAYLRRGCDGGDAEGCYHLGAAELPRKGDPPEPAYLLLERSCEGDFGTACAALGKVHLQRKTSFDDEIAARHLESACDNGHFESCKQLGEMYARGKGVEKDRVRAKEFAQRYSVNATRKHVRVGIQAGFPYVAGGTAELVVPVPVGPALALTGSYSYLPRLGGVMVQLKGDSYPDNPPDLTWVDAGLRLYPNNKARGLFVMAGAHRLQASGGSLAGGPALTRQGFSARLGIHNDARWSYTRVEMGIGQYGLVNLNDFDEDETGSFPLIQATLGFSVGLAPF